MRRRAPTAGRDPKFRALVALAVIALLGASMFGVLTFRGGSGTSDRAAAVSPGPPGSTPFVSRAGGFGVRVPKGMRVSRSGTSARFTSTANDLVVSVGPIAGGPLADATQKLLETVRGGYPRLSLSRGEPERVDGRRGMGISGQVRNTKGVPLRFVVVTVPASPHNFAVTAFAANGADPRAVLPRVNAIVNTFHILGAH